MLTEPRCNMTPAEVAELTERIAALKAERDGLIAEKTKSSLKGVVRGFMSGSDCKRDYEAEIETLKAERDGLAAAMESLKADLRKFAIEEGHIAAIEYLGGMDNPEYADILAARDVEMKRQGAVEAKTELLEESLAGLNAQGALVNGEDILSICADEIRRRLAALKKGGE